MVEVLLALVVIGVVAAYTIPTFFANYQKTQYVTQLKQVYSQITEAIKLMMIDENVDKVPQTNILTQDDDWDASLQRAGGFLKKYFKVIKDCGVTNAGGCFADNYTSLDGSNSGPPMLNNCYGVIISNGASICVVPGAGAVSRPCVFKVDINGPKKPNIAGRDLFMISVYYDGTLDEGVTPECRRGLPNVYAGLCGGSTNAEAARKDRFDNLCKSQPSGIYGSGCFGKILNDNWKMDY